MLLWAKLLIGITLAVGAQNEGQSPQSAITEGENDLPPLSDFVNRNNSCFNVKAEVCSAELKNPCSCRSINNDSLVCCNITNFNELKKGLNCSSKDP